MICIMFFCNAHHFIGRMCDIMSQVTVTVWPRLWTAQRVKSGRKLEQPVSPRTGSPIQYTGESYDCVNGMVAPASMARAPYADNRGGEPSWKK